MEILIAVGIGAVVLVIAVVAIVIILAKFRIVPEADQAVVITGSTVKRTDEQGNTTQKPKVVVGGGAYAIPIWNKYKLVPLEVVQIPISWKKGGESVSDTLPSKDRIPVELQGELSVHVDGENEDQIILASQKLGIPNQAGLLVRGEKKFSMKEAVKAKADKLVQAALRTAVFEFEFVELNSDKEKFEERVQILLQKDLARFGLTLTAVSIPHVSQGDFGAEGRGDMFDEEGRRRVAEIVEAAKTQTNDIEKTNTIARQERDLKARENELTLDYEKAQKEADQARQVEEYEAQQAAATRKEVLNQEQSVKEAEATQDRAIKEAQIEEARKVEEKEIDKAKQVAIAQAKADALKVAEEAAKREAEEDAKRREEEAEIVKAKAVEAAKIEKDKAIKVADEQRQQAIEEAEVSRQKAVALVRAEEAEARAAQAHKEAEQKAAEEKIITVKETAEADRKKQVVVMVGRQEKEWGFSDYTEMTTESASRWLAWVEEWATSHR